MEKSLVKELHYAFTFVFMLSMGKPFYLPIEFFPKNNGTFWYNKIDGIVFGVGMWI